MFLVVYCERKNNEKVIYLYPVQFINFYIFEGAITKVLPVNVVTVKDLSGNPDN